MDEYIGQDIPAGPERQRFLADNADVLVEREYRRRLTKEEKDTMRQRLVSLNTDLIAAEENKKATMADLTAGIKEIRNDIEDLVSDLNAGTVPTYGTCYKIIEGDEVGIYDGDGCLVESRAATPQEMQQTIFGEMRKAGG